MKTILYDGEIVGTVAKFEMEGEADVTYWIDKKHWGKGITTAALKAFLPLEPMRPLFGRAAFDNYGSIRVLEKCGFRKIGTDKGFANARGKEIEEFIFRYKVEAFLGLNICNSKLFFRGTNIRKILNFHMPCFVKILWVKLTFR